MTLFLVQSSENPGHLYPTIEAASLRLISSSEASILIPAIQEIYIRRIDARRREGLLRTATIQNPPSEIHNLVLHEELGFAYPLDLDTVVETFALGENFYETLGREVSIQKFATPPIFIARESVLAGDLEQYLKRAIVKTTSYQRQRPNTRGITEDYAREHYLIIPAHDGDDFVLVEDLEARYRAILSDLESFVAQVYSGTVDLQSIEFQGLISDAGKMHTITTHPTRQSTEASPESFSWNYVEKALIPHDEYQDIDLKKKRTTELRFWRGHIEDLLERANTRFRVPGNHLQSVLSFLHEQTSWSVRPESYAPSTLRVPSIKEVSFEGKNAGRSNSLERSVDEKKKTRDILSAYIKDIYRYPRLTRTEELKFARTLTNTRCELELHLYEFDRIAEITLQLANAALEKGQLPKEVLKSNCYEDLESFDLIETPELREYIPTYIKKAQDALDSKRLLERALRTSPESEANTLKNQIAQQRKIYAEYCWKIHLHVDYANTFLKRVQAKAPAFTKYPSEPTLILQQPTLTQLIDTYVKTLEGNAQFNGNHLDEIMDGVDLFVNESSSFVSEKLKLMEPIYRKYVNQKKGLANGNLRLVVSIAKNYRNRGLSFMDLIGEGNTGLLISIEKYDYKLDWRFSTYATFWIRQRMTRAIADQTNTVRITVQRREMIGLIRRIEHEFMQVHHYLPSLEQIFELLPEQLEITYEQLQRADRARVKQLHWHTRVGDHQDSSLGSLVEDVTVTPVAANMEHEELSMLLERLLDTLTQPEAEIIRRRYGLGYSPMTLDEVGDEFGLSRESIRKIQARAERKLQHPCRRSILEAYEMPTNPGAEAARTDRKPDGNEARRRKSIAAINNLRKYILKL